MAAKKKAEKKTEKKPVKKAEKKADKKIVKKVSGRAVKKTDSRVDIDLEKLLEAGAHFGHQTKRWNPKMEDYVYGVRDGVYIIDLIRTKKELENAVEVLQKAKKDKKQILFVGTKKQAKAKLREIAEKTGYPFVDERWLGGTLTNYSQVKDSVRTLEDLKKGVKNGDYDEYTKKERLLIQRRIDKLEKMVGGIKDLDGKPDLMVIVDIKREQGAVLEAQKMDVETIGLVDTNSDPTMVDHAIPVNDDANASVSYILDLLGKALE